MKLDSEQQGEVILALINNSTVSGQAIDQVYDLKTSVKEAIKEFKGDPQ